VLFRFLLQMQRKVFTQCRPALQRTAASRLVTVRSMATAAPSHNPTAITKKVFFDMEIGGNNAGESPCTRPTLTTWQGQVDRGH
jgi:hypothetical protein